MVRGGTRRYEEVRQGGGLLRADTDAPPRVQAAILNKPVLICSELAGGRLRTRTATVSYKEEGRRCVYVASAGRAPPILNKSALTYAELS